LPDHLIEQLTLKDPATRDRRTSLTPDNETLLEYCSALTIMLLNNQNLSEKKRADERNSVRDDRFA
jgi:hypothetical protein